jgi:uncharacterized protein YigA (DUF484 family)
MEVMRDKYKALELRMSDLIRLAQDNANIANKFHAWTQGCCCTRHDAELPAPGRGPARRASPCRR